MVAMFHLHGVRWSGDTFYLYLLHHLKLAFWAKPQVVNKSPSLTGTAEGGWKYYWLGQYQPSEKDLWSVDWVCLHPLQVRFDISSTFLTQRPNAASLVWEHLPGGSPSLSHQDPQPLVQEILGPFLLLGHFEQRLFMGKLLKNVYFIFYDTIIYHSAFFVFMYFKNLSSTWILKEI